MLQEESDKKIAEADKKRLDAEFKAGFLEATITYPQAKQYEKEIRTYATEKGLGVDEATVLVLGKKGQLQTGNERETARVESSSYGGTTATTAPTGEKTPLQMTQEERLAELRKREQEGRWGTDDQGLHFYD